MIRKIINISQNMLIADSAIVADSFWARFSGLMMRKPIKPNEAVVFYHTTGIHSFFMRFHLDLVFLDKQMKVIKVVKMLAPWRTVWCFQAYCAMEFLGGTVKNIAIGDILEVR